MATIRIEDNKGKHVQTWSVSDNELGSYFEIIMAKFEWNDIGKKNYLKVMGEKSIKDVINGFQKRKSPNSNSGMGKKE